MSTVFEYTLIDPDSNEETLVELHYTPKECEDIVFIYGDGPDNPPLRLNCGPGTMDYIEGVLSGEYLIKGE